MKDFFDDGLFLTTDTARALYRTVRDLPIIDYHCHLDPRLIAENAPVGDIGSLWLAGDHYKWRAMRMCGVPERYITGEADAHEKFLHYAAILPSLCGNPLYYWSHMELRALCGIEKPLSADTAEEIWQTANKRLAGLRVRDLLARFGVSYIATTDDPVDTLAWHGRHGDVTVAPTFRPDRALSLDGAYLLELGRVAGASTDTLSGLKEALLCRLDYFAAHGCRISDHGFARLPARIAAESEAAALYLQRDGLDAASREALFGHLLAFLLRAYKKRGITAQLHFAVARNVNPEAFAEMGPDSGFDVIGEQPSSVALAAFLATLPEAERPDILLYTLNDSTLPALASVTGAFRRVRMGAAWWFNDTALGIRRNLRTIAEYAALGESTGMLTDSRSLSAYVRFDFFRRLLADVVGGYVARGEYDLGAAKALMHRICYENPAALIEK